MNVLPHVNGETHVIAILGVTDLDPGDGDGWLLADYCLLNQMLKGTGQRWLCISEALEEYGKVFHGNTFCQRKVVCSRDNPLHDVVECDIESSQQSVLIAAKDVCMECQPPAYHACVDTARFEPLGCASEENRGGRCSYRVRLMQ